MHCGHIPRDRWAEPASIPERFGGELYDCDLCPGAACRRPLVCDIAAAYSFKENLLAAFPDPHNHIVEGVACLSRSINALEQYRTEKLRQKA